MSDEEKTIIHGDHDKYGFGQAVSSICTLLLLIALGLACNDHFTIFMMELVR